MATSARAAFTPASISIWNRLPASANSAAFLDRAADIVIAHGGSLSGEHGDGQARGALLPKMFGAELMQAFSEFKTLWDPDNRMNPGKMIEPVESRHAVYQPEDNLRLGAGYQSPQPRDVLSISRRSWLLRRSDVALRRRRRMPQGERRNHVPQLHGHTRGAALHARPRPPAMGNARRRSSCLPAGTTKPSTKPSTSASPAKPAKPSAPSTWTWPRTRPSSSPTTGTTASARPSTTPSASWTAWRTCLR